MLTRRQQIVQLLTAGSFSVRDLAAELGVQMRRVVEDLEHVRRSLRERRLLTVAPASCDGCGKVFTDRRRFTAPSRCPVCRSERTTEPVLHIE